MNRVCFILGLNLNTTEMVQVFKFEKIRVTFILLLASLVLYSACNSSGGNNKVFLGESDLPGGLSFSNPAEFEFTITEKQTGACDMVVEITYDPAALDGKTELPLYYQTVFPDSSEKDKRIKIPLKENGKWKGELMDDQTHYKFSYEIGKATHLKRGKHEFRLFADTAINQPLKAITHVVFKVEKTGDTSE